MILRETAALTSAPPSVADIKKLAAAELSLPSRRRYVLLLFVAVTMAILVTSLIATEPALPPRTQAAFAVMLAMALVWAGFAGWVLSARRALFGRDRVIAARLGLTFSALSAGLMMAAGMWAGGGRPLVVGGFVQLALCLPAYWMLIRAKQRLHALLARKRELEARVA